MYCPKCDEGNPERARFCMHCGADLRGYRKTLVVSSEKTSGGTPENKFFSNPFDIPLNNFKKLSFSDYISLSEKAYRLCREEIRKFFKASNLHHVVICNGKVIYSSSNLLGIDRKTVENLMKEIGKPCYVFSREDMVEEASWIKINEDYYPTIELILGNKSWEDEEVARKGKKVLSDFDTGNPYYTIFNEKSGENIIAPVSFYETHRGMHLGRPYWFFLREVKICIKDIIQKFKCKPMQARFVMFWEESPLLLANPRRNGFVGRNIMFSFNLRVILNPKDYISEVILL